MIPESQRRYLINTLMRSHIDRMRGVLQSLPPAALVGLKLTTFCRSQEYNAAVEGRDYSQHLLCLATDWDWVRDPPLAVRQQFINAVRRTGLVAIDEGDHIHVQTLPASYAYRLGLFG